jgi:LacI family transcriptional regulator
MKKPRKHAPEYHGVKEIARRAGVSIATVDRVLHNRPGVSSATKEKIDQIIKELNYQPNLIASRLASRKTFNIAALIPKISAETDFWQAPLNGIEHAHGTIKEYGIHVEVYFFDLENRRSFEKQANLLLDKGIDGILMAPSFINESARFAAACRERRIPFVLIDSNIPGQEGLCYIGPHLFRSGYLSGQLMDFTLKARSEILVVNIAKEVDDHDYLIQIEEGFRAYFRYHNLPHEILKMETTRTDFLSVEKSLVGVFRDHPGIKAVFVTNSRVSTVAHYLEKAGKSDIFLIGYDFIRENIEYLKNDVIDVLICHKPEEQGYKGIMALYQHLVLGSRIEKVTFMPIDIITKENYEFYHN